jgi:hypothetical protein
MELGNLIFGNSRGNFEIPRSIGWEEELYRVFDAIKPDEENSYGFNFENNTFMIFPYYWGECTCGYEDLEYEWSETTKHQEHCYQIKLKDIQKQWAIKSNKLDEFNRDGYFSEYSLSSKLQKEFEKDVESLCKSMNLPYPECSAVHCTCDRQEKWRAFAEKHYHESNCPIIRPNFLYKSNNFWIKWYKYPFRDSYMSDDITLEEFSNIITECIKSLY